jgi:hypothetical protein
MVKQFAVILYSANPPRIITCLASDPRVRESHTIITSNSWAAPSISDPTKMQTFSIGENRQPGDNCQGIVAIGVYNHHQIRGFREAVSMAFELGRPLSS